MQPSASDPERGAWREPAGVSAGTVSRPHYNGCRAPDLDLASAGPAQPRPGEDGVVAACEAQRFSLC